MSQADRPLRVLLVDDEEPARILLREHLRAMPDVQVVGESGDGFTAVQAVSRLRPDVLLLDVQMPKLDGFEVLELLDPAPAVIFVTAYDEYAVKAFEVHAVDYLMKPVTAARLAEALERARRRPSPPPSPEKLRAAARGDRGPLARILVREGEQVHVIPAEEVDYVEARDDSILIRARGRDFLKSARLAALEKQLDPERFVRIHRSYLLNVERLARVELYAKDSRLAILRDGRRLPMSRSGYARLRERL